MRAHRTVVAVALAALLVTSGCIGFLTGSEALEFSAESATVSDAALADSGYEEANVTGEEVNETFSAAGQERRVRVTNWLAQYERAVDLGPLGEKRAAVFVALSTPKVEVLGRTFNPLADTSNRDLLQRLQSRYSGLRVGDRVDSRNVTALGAQRTVDTFEGQATFAGVDVDVYVHVTKFEHDGDIVAAIAIHPQQLDGERETVDDLLAGLEHGG